jgi:hypothetical protein
MTGLASGKESTPVRTKQVWVAFADGVPAPFGPIAASATWFRLRVSDEEAAVVEFLQLGLGAFAG